jgi:hypothetical protein
MQRRSFVGAYAPGVGWRCEMEQQQKGSRRRRKLEADAARDHLQLVTSEPARPAPYVPGQAPSVPAPPTTIGRLIARTALLADGAIARRLRAPVRPRRFGWFR